MQQQTDRIFHKMKAKGLRVTPQRLAVYADLLARSDHPTAEEISSHLNQDAPIASQATVYNSLQALRKVGLVQEVLLEEGVCRYDANLEDHHHFRCQSCGEIEDIAWELIQGIDFTALQPGLKIKNYQITVHGYCERCHSE